MGVTSVIGETIKTSLQEQIPWGIIKAYAFEPIVYSWLSTKGGGFHLIWKLFSLGI